MSQTVERALAILELLAESPRTLTEVSEHLGVHKSTASRLIQTLESQGFATHDGRHVYRLGHRLFTLSARALSSLDIRTVAAPHLHRFGELTAETVHLASLEGEEIIYIDKVESSQSVRMYSRIGKEAPLHCTGVAKAIMAYRPKHEVTSAAARIDFQRFTARTLSSPQEWMDDLTQVRKRGYAIDDREHEDYVHCIAAPIRTPDGEVRHALSMSATTMSKSRRQLIGFVPAMLETVQAIEAELGREG